MNTEPKPGEIITQTSEEFFEAIRQIEGDGGRVVIAERLGRTGHTGWRLRYNRAEDRQRIAPACPPLDDCTPPNANMVELLPDAPSACQCDLCREAKEYGL